MKKTCLPRTRPAGKFTSKLKTKVVWGKPLKKGKTPDLAQKFEIGQQQIN